MTSDQGRETRHVVLTRAACLVFGGVLLTRASGLLLIATLLVLALAVAGDLYYLEVRQRTDR